ncbi:MAG TPA: YdcF family protein [Octadecabacter sp.]|nr:YdcF family protein [Octadecabacter sp.]
MKTGLILGAAVWANGPSPTLLRRTQHGATLFHAGQIERIVACGGLGKHPPSEAEAMAEILYAENVPPNAVTLEDQSTTTGENVTNALALVGDCPIVLITDWYHAPRARLIARRAGFKSVTSSAPPVRNARPWPQVKGAIREIPAYIAYYLGLKS